MADLAIPTSNLPPFMENVDDSSDHASDIQARYNVAYEHIDLGSRSLSMLKIENPNSLLERIDPVEFAADERLPYWAELWPSSIALARFCLSEANMHKKDVLELGCGLGLAGIAAAAAGAHVAFTDYEADALRFARFNARANLSPEVCGTSTEFQLFDWRSRSEVKRVDMVLGADVVYERTQFLPLLRFVQRSLKNNGCAVFTDPDRSTGMSFFVLAEREGFEVTLSSQVLNFRGKDITILLGILRPPG